MKKIFLVAQAASILFASQMSFAADNEAQTVRQFKISYLNPGVEFEQPIMKKASVIVHPAVGYSFIASNDDFVGFLNPYIDLQCRYYYNLAKKYEQSGENNNSGCFLAINCTYNFKDFYSTDDDYELRNNVTFGALWGVQWTKRHTYLRFNAGPGYYVNSDSDSGFAPIAEFSIGWKF